MSDQQIDVRIRAQTSDLKQGMEGAAQTVQQASARMREAVQTAADRMRDAFDRMKDSAKGAGGAGEAMQAAKDQMRDAATGMTGSMSGVVQALSAIPGPAKAAVAALVGVFAAKHFADGAAKMTESSMDLARVLGSSTNTAQKWRVALDDVGASQGELEGAAKGMSRQLRENEDDLNKLGLKTRDASGNLRPMTELLQDGIGIVNKYAEGADRAQVAQTVFGRGVDSSSKLLLVNDEVLESAGQTMRKFGLEVGSNAVAAWKEFDAANDEAAAGMKGIGYTIGAIVMPIITDLVNAFNAAIPAAITVLKGALGGLATAFHAIKNGVVVVWETINAMVVTAAEPIRALAEAIGRAVTGDFDGAAQAIKGIGGVISGAWSGAMNEIADSSQKTRDRIDAIWSKDSAPGEPEGERGNLRAPNTSKAAKKEAKEASQMPVYEAELARKIELFEKAAQAEGTLRQYSKQEEAAYWQEVSQRAGVSAEDKARAEKKWRDLERGLRSEAFAVEMADLEQRKQAAQQNFVERIRLAEEAHSKTVAMYGAESKEAAAAWGKVLEERRKHNDQLQKLDEVKAQRKREIDLAAIADEQRDAQMQLELGLITKEQLLAQQAQFEERMTDIKRQALIERLALIDPQADPVKKAEIDAQIEQLETQHQQRLGEIRRQQHVEGMSPATSFFGSMGGAFESAIDGMLTKAMTLKEAMDNIWRSMAASFVKEFIAKKIAATMQSFVQERALAVGNAVTQTSLYKVLTGAKVASVTAGTAANVASVGPDVAASGTKASAAIGEAAAKGAGSVAGIPFVGPALAVAAFAAIMALMKGGGGGDKTTTTTTRIPMSGVSVPSAAGGFDIPAGINPLTQLHEKEMVLPQAQADAVRQMAESSAGGTVVINATGGDFIHKRDLVKLLTQMKRDFRFA